MKVGSSLTISLIIKNKLWGLIACHNSKPVQIPVNIKSLCDKAGIFISKKIEKIILKEKIDQIDKARKIVKNLLTNQITPESITELKSLCECSGVGIYTSTLNVSEGIVPELAEFQLFMEWIFFYPKFIIFQTDEISKFIPEAKNWQNKICGILALKIQDGFIIWYRQEYIREIKWAGNPEKPTYLDQEKARISPRKSFEIWKEISQFKSNEWTEIEIEKVKLLSKI
jgi:light-regulated signal transduction histidine kinase (bacteriophytochrome)